jgi:hypothetical protein
VDVPEVASAFQPVQTVVPPTKVEQYIAPPNQTYMGTLLTLQASLDALAQQPTNNDAGKNTTLANATAAHGSARQVAQARSNPTPKRMWMRSRSNCWKTQSRT